MNSVAMTAASTTSAVLSLSKQAWKLGIALSKLDQDAEGSDITFKILTEDIKSLGIECDLVYAELDTVMSKSEIGSPHYNIDERSWNCLDTQMGEINQAMQELEMLVGRVRGEQFSFYGGAPRQRTLDECKDHVEVFRTKVCRHTHSLHTILLLINM